MHNKFTPEVPTTERYLQTVIDRQPCGKHNADKGEPCFTLPKTRGYTTAVCNRRAKRAGFNHRISLKSLSMMRSNKKK